MAVTIPVWPRGLGPDAGDLVFVIDEVVEGINQGTHPKTVGSVRESLASP